MIGVKDPDEYRRRRAEFLDKLVLKNPDINLLQSHPKEQYPFLVQTLEILLRQRVEAGNGLERFWQRYFHRSGAALEGFSVLRESPRFPDTHST